MSFGTHTFPMRMGILESWFWFKFQLLFNACSGRQQVMAPTVGTLACIWETSIAFLAPSLFLCHASCCGHLRKECNSSVSLLLKKLKIQFLGKLFLNILISNILCNHVNSIQVSHVIGYRCDFLCFLYSLHAKNFQFLFLLNFLNVIK